MAALAYWIIDTAGVGSFIALLIPGVAFIASPHHRALSSKFCARAASLADPSVVPPRRAKTP